MKTIYSITLTTLVFIMLIGCQKLPPYENLSSDFVVLTKYDTSVNFGVYKTFSIKDDIEVITGNPDDSVWNDQDAQSIINAVIQQMTSAGYTQVPVHSTPDLGIQLVGIRNTTTYYIPPGYWWGYPGWGGPCYWGYCGGGYYPYYPYYFTVSVTTGMLIVEMADLKHASEQGRINIVWNIIGNGQIGNSTSFIVDQCLKTVSQGFQQSPYIKTN
jgi:hypothetical protein